MKVLVCGGRDYADTAAMFSALDRIAAVLRVDHVIHGDAPGADTIAEAWARERRIAFTGYPADWTKFGKAAGPIRNQRMLDEGKPGLVVAFPTAASRGTWDMAERAQRAGVRVLVMPGAMSMIDALGEGVFV